LPAIHPEALARLLDGDDASPDLDLDTSFGQRRTERHRHDQRRPTAVGPGPRPRPHGRRHERETFKCGRCRAFIGPTVSGGRHRNHCPRCLTSRHVDDRRPGDRASPCRALMAPVGTAFKPKGEQVVLHRCNGCGVERRCRVAADDDPVALLRLPLVALAPRPAAADEDAAEIA